MQITFCLIDTHHGSHTAVSSNGERYAAPRLVYAGADQFRNMDVLTLDHPPVRYDLSFRGLTANADGVYKLSDFLSRIQKALDAYDGLILQYDGFG